MEKERGYLGLVGDTDTLPLWEPAELPTAEDFEPSEGIATLDDAVRITKRSNELNAWKAEYSVDVVVADRGEWNDWVFETDLAEQEEKARQKKTAAELGLTNKDGTPRDVASRLAVSPDFRKKNLVLTQRCFDLTLRGVRGPAIGKAGLELGSLQGPELYAALYKAGLAGDVRLVCSRFQAVTPKQRRLLPSAGGDGVGPP